MRPIGHDRLTGPSPASLMPAMRPRRRLAALVAALVMPLAGMGLTTAFAAAAAAAPAAPAPGVAPGAAAVSPSENDMFFTAADGAVWNQNALAGTPSNLRLVGGHLVSAPAPIWTGSQLVVFGQGTDNQLWYTTCPPFGSGGCGTWSPLGGMLTAKPGAVFTGPSGSDYSVYVRGTDGALWQRTNSPAGWGAWHSIGGQLLSGTGPSVTATNASPVVAVAGTDREVFLYGRTGTQSGFVNFGGQTASGPGVAYLSPGNVAVFARGSDNAAWYRQSGLPIGPIGAWHSIGGRLTSGLAADTVPGGSTYVFGLGTDNQVYDSSGAYPAFGPWNRLTGF